MRLTDRTFATGVTKQDLIHIVITGDTSQSPEGSSYKATVGQILELYNLPAPNVKIIGTTDSMGEYIPTLNKDNTVGPDIKLINYPVITLTDLSQEQFDNNVFIEMVQYKIRKKSKTVSSHGVNKFVGGSYVVQPRIDDDGYGNKINVLEYRIWNYYGKTINDRGGIQSFSDGMPLAINRMNHYQVYNRNQQIDLFNYFAGRFTYDTIYYLDETGTPNSISGIPVPTTNRSKNYSDTHGGYNPLNSKLKSGNDGSGHSYKMCYNGNLTSLYVAFRYLMFDPDSNNGKGKFVTGPLSPIIKVTNKFFPLANTPTQGWCKANPAIIGHESEIMFSFVNKP
jgi:hypothetical protein